MSANRISEPVAAAVAAVIFFIATFLPMVGASISVFGISASATIDAWHSWATPCLLIFFAIAIIWALQEFGSGVVPSVQRYVPMVAGAMTVLLLIRILTWTGNHVGLRWGAFVLIIAGAVFTFLTARQAGLIQRGNAI